mmetsp:Transcript_11280/g.20388  ORF Transcript_11280/g.20388 Transcript_11280/m.20388 type:complete len:127 (+) Transcript_11280:49-429(+)
MIIFLLCLTLGILYPIYDSYRALYNSSFLDQLKWLTYWTLITILYSVRTQQSQSFHFSCTLYKLPSILFLTLNSSTHFLFIDFTYNSIQSLAHSIFFTFSTVFPILARITILQRIHKALSTVHYIS